MRSNPVPNSRRAGGIRIAAAALVLAGCGSPEPNEVASQNVLAEPPAAAVNLAKALPLPEPDLDREDLLLAAIRAASAHATGTDDQEAQRALAGRQFSFRMRFGCHGPVATAEGEADTAPLEWSYEENAERLRVRAAPDIVEEQPRVQAIAGDEHEAVRGFWVHQPWLLQSACAPKAATQDMPPAIGIAQFFDAGSSPRPRNRIYESVQRIPADGLPGDAGFELVISGRLKALSDGDVIRCTTVDGSARPVCLISAEFDRVAIENAANETQLAEWTRG